MKPNPTTSGRGLPAAIGLLLVAATSHADITYVDAQEGASGNTYATSGTLADTTWIDLVSNSSSTNNTDWMKRSGGSPGWSQHNGGDVIQGSVTTFPNDLGEITTEITGLADGKYDVWVFFWEQIVSSTQDWMISAGLESGSLTAYSSPVGPVAGTDSTTAVDAGTLTFTNSPSTTAAGGNQTMFGVKLGEVAVSGGVPIFVYVDKLAGVGSNQRTIFDGVGYEFVGPLAPPDLSSTDPADDATGVVTTANLVATFNEPVQPGTSGNITIKRASDDATIEVLDVNDTTAPGTVTFDGSAVTIDPTDDLAAGVEYYVLIDAGAIENSIPLPYPGLTGTGDWSFTTDGTAPTSTAMTPMTGTIGAQPNPGLSLTFDEDVLGVAGKFITVHLSDGTVIEAVDATAATIAGGDVSISLSAALTLGDSYYVTVEAGAFTDLSGNAYAGISGTSAWTFTTALADITYVDAVEGAAGNTFATGGSLEDTSWQADTGSESLWRKRTGLGGSNGDTLFEALHGIGDGDPDEIPELTTRITGLADGTYQVWAFYWDQVVSNTQNWTISAGLTSGALTSYSSPGEPSIDGATTTGVTYAGNLTFTNSVNVDGANDPDPTILRNLFGVNLGTFSVSDGSGTIDVFIDNLLGGGSGNRTWYEGVGYQLVGAATPLEITSFAPVGEGNWEVTLEGAAGATYEFRSSPALTFDPGTRVTGLTQGDPGDPGTVGGSNNSRVTTNASGQATVRLALGGPDNFIRAQLPLPLLSEDFEADDGGFLPSTVEGTPWAWGDPDSGGPGGTVTAGANGSTNCWGTGLGNPGYYTNPTNTCLRSTVIDLTGVTAAELSFAMALDLDGADSVTVNIIDDTSDTVIAADIVAITDGDINNAFWQSVGPVTIPAPALGAPIRIEWCLSGTGGIGADFMGWYLDDVVVTDSSP